MWQIHIIWVILSSMIFSWFQTLFYTLMSLLKVAGFVFILILCFPKLNCMYNNLWSKWDSMLIVSNQTLSTKNQILNSKCHKFSSDISSYSVMWLNHENFDVGSYVLSPESFNALWELMTKQLSMILKFWLLFLIRRPSDVCRHIQTQSTTPQ